MNTIVRRLLTFISTITIGLSGCGEVPVDIDKDTYEPKIVVEGYLFPGQTPGNIRLSRNYALEQQIEMNELFLDNARATITDVAANKSYDLEFNGATLAYHYPGTDWVIEAGKSYRLDVVAAIEGQEVVTSSTTHVPEAGFGIQREESLLGPINYSEDLPNDKKMRLVYDRSPSTDSYILSVVALDASLESFIEDNIFGIDKDRFDEWDDTDELQFFNFLKYQYQWHQTPMGPGRSQLDIEYFTTWFFSRYRVILYAADENFADYLLTHDQIQEIDGNLLEPEFHFQGDGIGVFGSAIADTVFVEVRE